MQYGAYALALVIIPLWSVHQMSGPLPSGQVDEKECQTVMINPYGTSYEWEEIQADKMLATDPVGAQLRRIYNRVNEGLVNEAFAHMSILRAMDPGKTYRKRAFAGEIGNAFIAIARDEEAKKWFTELEEDPHATVARIFHAQYLLTTNQDAEIALRLTREVYDKPDGLMGINDYLLYASVLEWNGESAQAKLIADRGIQLYKGDGIEATEETSLEKLSRKIIIK